MPAYFARLRGPCGWKLFPFSVFSARTIGARGLGFIQRAKTNIMRGSVSTRVLSVTQALIRGHQPVTWDPEHSSH